MILLIEFICYNKTLFTLFIFKMSGPVLDEDQTDLFLKKIMNVLNSRSKVGDIDVIKQTLQEEQKVYDKVCSFCHL